MPKLSSYFLTLLAFWSFSSCLQPTSEVDKATKPSVAIDLDAIVERGKLIALTDYSSTSYFIYKGRPMGFEYEMLEAYAKHLGVSLEIEIIDNLDKMITYLNEGKGDVIAANITVTKKRMEQVNFTIPHLKTTQVLVQRMNDSIPIIRDVNELNGKTIYVRKESAFFERLENLNEEIGGSMDIETVSGQFDTEQLIAMVANGEISYTIADKNIARVNQHFFPNIDVETEISFPQKIAWAVRTNSTQLLSDMDEWLEKIKRKNEYFAIRDKYFKARTQHSKRVQSDYSSHAGGKISSYDQTIKNYKHIIGWDWRLIASLIYQESKFQVDAQSWTGATGLMQIMPETAAEFNVFDLTDPNENIRVGLLYLAWLNKFWSERIKNEEERINFILASYNVGSGHVLDAQRLAEKYNADKLKWVGNVEVYLEKKSLPEFYNSPESKYGYCRGAEPVRYVKEIMERYKHYQNHIYQEDY